MLNESRKYKSTAHQYTRYSGFQCVGCNRGLKNARYDGEYCFGYDKQGKERWMAVFMTCRCGTINEVTTDMTDTVGFMDAIDDVHRVPRAATKITQETERANNYE